MYIEYNDIRTTFKLLRIVLFNRIIKIIILLIIYYYLLFISIIYLNLSKYELNILKLKMKLVLYF